MEENKDLPLPSWLLNAMKATEQNPKYHGEGNVLNHTLLVLETFEMYKDEFDLSPAEQEVMYWASILHDIGKPAVTTWKRNRWTAHGHERAGLPFARNILLKHPEINQQQRRQILDLVKYHSIPLQWGLKRIGEGEYRKLAVKTDLRLLGIFSFFDIMGRDCMDKNHILSLDRDFNENVVPKITYEMGSFEDIQKTYQEAPLKQKNALWNSLKFDDGKLTRKLLAAPKPENEVPKFQAALTLSLPNSKKEDYIRQHYPHFKPFPLQNLSVSQVNPHERENLLRQVKHFISVWGEARKPVLINGSLLDTATRNYLAEYCRNMGAEVSYLIFDEIDPDFEDYSLPKRKEVLDYPHPWESHQTEVVASPSKGLPLQRPE